MEPKRAAISRETRQLLVVALSAVALLWVLARIRFADRVPAQNPVAPVLAQLTPPSTFDEMASAVAQLGSRLAPIVIAVDPDRDGANSRPRERRPRTALRLGGDLAVMLMEEPAGSGEARPGVDVIARDAASGVAVIRVDSASDAAPSVWSPRRLQEPRFLIAATASREAATLRPVFVSSLESSVSPAWTDPIWAMPEDTDIAPGSFVFTHQGTLVGLVVEHEGTPAIVPAETLLAAADRLLHDGQKTPGQLGIEVQALTPDLAAATGTSAGVMITWVDREGPAAGQLTATDVINVLNGEPITTPEQWTTRTARLADGDSVLVKLTRRGEMKEVRLVARQIGDARANAAPQRTPGFTLRAVRRVGVELVRVDRDSAAARAGLEPGDIVTSIGTVNAPMPAQVRRLFSAATPDRPLIVAFTRGDRHHVTTLNKQW